MPRTTVASISTAAAVPMPRILRSTRGSGAREDSGRRSRTRPPSPRRRPAGWGCPPRPGRRIPQQQDQRERHRGGFGLAEAQRAVDGRAMLASPVSATIRPGWAAAQPLPRAGPRTADRRWARCRHVERDQRRAGDDACAEGGCRRLPRRRRRSRGTTAGRSGWPPPAGQPAAGLRRAQTLAGCARLDQHGLTGRAVRSRPARLVQGPFGLARLAGIVAGQVLRTERLADHEQQGDQREPAEGGGLEVPGAPPGDPFDGRAFSRPLIAIAVCGSAGT